MAINSTFYTGAVDNVAWAKGSGRLGFSYVAHGASDCKVSIVGTGTRTVRVAAGSISGAGVTDVNTSLVDIPLPNVTSGSQWFMIVARRIWQTTNATTFTYIAGNSTRQLPPRTVNPGTQDDQPLALVRIQAGQTLPQEIVDLRVIGSNNGIMVGFDTLCLSYLTDIGTVVRIGDVEWTRGVSSSGSAVWLPSRADSVATVNGGWTAAGGSPRVAVRNGIATLQATMRRTSGPSDVCLIIPEEYRPRDVQPYPRTTIRGVNAGESIGPEVQCYINPSNGYVTLSQIGTSPAWNTGSYFVIHMSWPLG